MHSKYQPMYVEVRQCNAMGGEKSTLGSSLSLSNQTKYEQGR